ncbi:right-handed parallel beta-helix repeat-containing protein [Acinetobacter ursingii]|uniref:right-handed parallel beta-helix repeat-containing protein n=1 Tax=Acinetobacter ursingii TaxID=108980 RepID=UPI00244A1E8C|nr:right-handed parallel beta-helix repeat-containing protein [Acinetobacter ursingii]MDH2019419.1 right-handed parallel beta-helix repeat-containing protein [Acinetobacter ursingii]MDH2071843.1 right-handed parallel beta-helix repeat-containing protein [Acinetobacter ursingii]
MTVPVSDRLSQLYVGNGTNTRFDFTFRVFDQEDENGVTVRVKKGTEFEDMDKTMYQVKINQDEMGGYVTFTTAPNNQTFFYVAGQTPIDQLLDITNYDNFYPDAIERSLDKLTAILQEWNHLLSSEAQSRILADINYDLLAQQREADLKAYIDSIASTISGQPVFGLLTKFVDTQIDDAKTQYLLNRKIVTTVESIADLLTLEKWQGRTVNVKSFHRGLGKGGGNFSYDSAQSLLNNGCTTIDGWVRDISSMLLSTDDAGLIGDGTDENVTSRLQSILSAAKDGFTIKIIGKYLINRHLVVYTVKNLGILGVDSDIKGDPNNWTWDTTHIKPDETWYHPRGMIIAIDCPDIYARELKITGINRNSKHSGADQWQDGDVGIQGLRCDNASVVNNVISNTYAWGVSIEGSRDAKVYNNTISLVTIQSGINCVNDSNGGTAYVYNNTISDIGLYGIEFESLKSYNMKCYNNVVDNCYAGIIALANDNFIKGDINSNTISNCEYAIYPANLKNPLNQIDINSNSLANSIYGINISDGNGLTVKSNNINGMFTRDVLQKFGPNTFVAEVLSSNQFLVQRDLINSYNVSVGSQLYVKNTLMTVTAISENTKKWTHGDVANDWFYIITISQNVLDDTYLFRHLYKLITAGTRGEVGIQRLGSLKNNAINLNSVSGFQYNLYKDNSSADISYNEFVSSNILTSAGSLDILNPNPTMGCKYTNNSVNGVTNIHRDLIEKGNITLTPFISTKLGVSLSSSSAAPSDATVYSPIQKRILASTIQLIAASETTGHLTITINGWDYVAQATGSGVATIASNIELNKGVNTVKVKSSTKDLTYSDVYISFLTA